MLSCPAWTCAASIWWWGAAVHTQLYGLMGSDDTQLMMGSSVHMVTWWQKTDGSWETTVVYRKLHQVVTPIVAAVSGAVSLLEQMNPSPGTQDAATDLANAFSLIPDGFQWCSGSHKIRVFSELVSSIPWKVWLFPFGRSWEKDW